MKKTIVLIVCLFISFEFANAQVRKIYVSLKGGKMLEENSVKFGYNFTSYKFNIDCDTLICHDPGYETCKVPDSLVQINGMVGISSYLFDETMEKSIRKIQKMKRRSGRFYLTTEEHRVLVIFKNAKRTGEADFVIQVK